LPFSEFGIVDPENEEIEKRKEKGKKRGKTVEFGERRNTENETSKS
jgi:hypothetical protein